MRREKQCTDLQLTEGSAMNQKNRANGGEREELHRLASRAVAEGTVTTPSGSTSFSANSLPSVRLFRRRSDGRPASYPRVVGDAS